MDDFLRFYSRVVVVFEIWLHVVVVESQGKPRNALKYVLHLPHDNFSFLNESVLHLHLVVQWRCHSRLKDAHWNERLQYFQSFEQKRPLNSYIAGKQKVDCLASSTLAKTS